jgi:heat shock protein HslJ
MLHTILRKKSIWLFFIAILMLVAACTPDSGGSIDSTPTPEAVDQPDTITDEITMIVGPEVVECEGVGPQTCLQVKFEDSTDWELFYDNIDGFEHQPGIESELRVNKITVENPPADGSSIRYELIEVVSQSETIPAVMEELDFLLNTNWDLVTMNGESPVDGATPTLAFDGENVNGTTGCNSYFAPFTLDGTVLTIGQAGQTEMFCDGRMEQEQAYLQMLMSAVSLTLENETLTIHTGEGEGSTGGDLVYQPAEHQALEGTAWNLSGIANNDAMVNTWIDEMITAEFNNGELGGNAGCNSYGTTYETSGSSITIGEIASTLMACEDQEIMDREAEYLATLQNVASFEIVRNNLTFFDADGNVVMSFIAYV